MQWISIYPNSLEIPAIWTAVVEILTDFSNLFGGNDVELPWAKYTYRNFLFLNESFYMEDYNFLVAEIFVLWKPLELLKQVYWLIGTVDILALEGLNERILDQIDFTTISEIFWTTQGH